MRVQTAIETGRMPRLFAKLRQLPVTASRRYHVYCVCSMPTAAAFMTGCNGGITTAGIPRHIRAGGT